MRHESDSDVLPPAASTLTLDLPRDQALGLRLIAIARAAAAMHMTESALMQHAPVRTVPAEHGAVSNPGAHLLRTQAARLVSHASEAAR